MPEFTDNEADKLERALEKTIQVDARLTAHEIHCVEAQRATGASIESLRSSVNTIQGELLGKLDQVSRDDVVAHNEIRAEIAGYHHDTAGQLSALTRTIHTRWIAIALAVIGLLLGIIGYLLTSGLPWR